MNDITEEEKYRRKAVLLERALAAAVEMDQKNEEQDGTNKEPDGQIEPPNSSTDDFCHCCSATVDAGDFKIGCCFRCGWREGMPIVDKELPDGFDDDLIEPFECAFPKDESN
jgi:hypothetical protein